MLDKEAKILVIGGGTFGLSTGLWLLRDGYQNVTIIDPYEMPSQMSAGYDINKIIQSSYSDVFTTKLALESLELWQNDPIFKPNFHEVGILYASTTDEPYEELLSMNRSRIEAGKDPLEALESHEEFIARAPQLTGSLPGWRGFFQKDECGWAHALNSLKSAAKEIERLGGKFVVGDVNGLIYEQDLVKGCITSNGERYLADKIVLSAGASSVKIMDFEEQLLAKCWTLAHIKLTEEEALKLKDKPVVVNFEKGFFFETDDNYELKVCNEFPGYTNYTKASENPESSIPVKKEAIPKIAVEEIRAFLKETIPEISEKPLVKAKICWCTDTPDRHFLIAEHPKYNGSLVLATGDSGHGFKHMPSIGRYIAKLVSLGEGSLGEEKTQKWRWRPETAKDRIQDRFGGSGHVSDLKDIEDWFEVEK